MSFDPTVFINEAFPAYLTAFATIGLLYVGWYQATQFRSESQARADETVLRASQEYLERQLHTEGLKEKRQKFINIIYKEGFAFNKLSEEEISTVTDVLNMNEALAIILESGGYNQEIIKNYERTRVVKDFEMTKDFISDVRALAKNANLFISFEKLAKKWENNL